MVPRWRSVAGRMIGFSPEGAASYALVASQRGAFALALPSPGPCPAPQPRGWTKRRSGRSFAWRWRTSREGQTFFSINLTNDHHGVGMFFLLSVSPSPFTASF
jgi:hypothetical protein